MSGNSNSLFSKPMGAQAQKNGKPTGTTAPSILRAPPMGEKDRVISVRFDDDTLNLLSKITTAVAKLTGTDENRSEVIRAATFWLIPEALRHLGMMETPEGGSLYADWLRMEQARERQETLRRIGLAERDFEETLRDAIILKDKKNNPTAAARILDGFFRTIEAYRQYGDELATNMNERVRGDYGYCGLVEKLDKELGLHVRWPVMESGDGDIP